MNAQQLHAVLGRLSGHLITDTPQKEAELRQLHQSLSQTLLPDDIRQLKSSTFNFEASDLFSAERISAERSAQLQAIAEKQAGGLAEPELRAFVREVPVRNPLLHASVPSWAAGSAVDHTVGPLTNADGRQFWFDFFRIEKLVALYVRSYLSWQLRIRETLTDRRRWCILAELTLATRLPCGCHPSTCCCFSF